MSTAGTRNSATPGTQRRWVGRPTSSPVTKLGMVFFAIGVLAIVADLVLFVAGSRNLPVWLNVMCMLAPVGLGIGLYGVVREARSSSRAATTVSASSLAGKTPPAADATRAADTGATDQK